MNEQYSALRSNVSMLGKVLGDTIKDALGENILDRVETIRKLSKSSRAGNEANRQELLTTLQNLSNDELLPVARAFSQFLNLANTAEQYHSISPKGEAASNPEVIARTHAAGVEEVVVKRGADSCLVAIAGQPQREVPAVKLPKEKVVDTTAAGDSFSAGYLAVRLTGGDAESAAKRGHLTASTVIQYRGAIIPREAMPQEL